MLWELRLQLMERPLLILPQCTVRRRDALVWCKFWATKSICSTQTWRLPF
jgi:hypothetical protein